MYKMTKDRLFVSTHGGKPIGVRTLYAKIVGSRGPSGYDKVYGRFEGFYVKVNNRWKRLHNMYTRPYVK